MKLRERIPKYIVYKYSTKICFMVKKNETLMKAVQPRPIWVTEMGYKIDAHILDLYAKMLIYALIDEKEKTFRIDKQKESKVQIGFSKKNREGKIKKVGQVVQKMSFEIK